MIVLGNQLVLQFSIGNKSNYLLKNDFLAVQDFKYMRIAENAGGLCPIIDLTFAITDPEVIPYLNTGNVITIVFGKDEPSSSVMQFEIGGDVKSKNFRVGQTVSLLGSLHNRAFTDQKRTGSMTGKSYEVLQMIAARDKLNFKTNANIKTTDSQLWAQCGKTDWTFSSYIANRAYKDSDTFFVHGFDCENFYLYDLKEHIKEGIRWILTTNHVGSNEKDCIVNIGSYSCHNKNAGTNADIVGKNVTNVCYNLDTGTFSNPKHSLKTFTTMDTDKVNINSTDCINYNYQITTSDEHSFSAEAQNQNYRNNVLYSSYTCHVPVTGQYRDFRLFDVVALVPGDSDPEAEGIYFITGIAKEFKDKQYSVLLTLNRESANGIRGDLEGGV